MLLAFFIMFNQCDMHAHLSRGGMHLRSLLFRGTFYLDKNKKVHFVPDLLQRALSPSSERTSCPQDGENAAMQQL